MALNTLQSLFKKWAKEKGIKLEYIPPGKPTKNGYIESFNGKVRQECLDQNLFLNLKEAQAIIETWRINYNEKRPHSSLSYLTPTEFVSQYFVKQEIKQTIETIEFIIRLNFWGRSTPINTIGENHKKNLLKK